MFQKLLFEKYKIWNLEDDPKYIKTEYVTWWEAVIQIL